MKSAELRTTVNLLMIQGLTFDQAIDKVHQKLRNPKMELFDFDPEQLHLMQQIGASALERAELARLNAQLNCKIAEQEYRIAHQTFDNLCDAQHIYGDAMRIQAAANGKATHTGKLKGVFQRFLGSGK